MNKGVTIESGTDSPRLPRGRGHGMPDVRVSESNGSRTIDSMDIVRQMFEAGLFSSAFSTASCSPTPGFMPSPSPTKLTSQTARGNIGKQRLRPW